MTEKSSKRNSTKFRAIIAGSTIILVAIIYFATVYPWPSENVFGTVGGVEKAKKYQKEQITKNDVTLQNSEIHDLIQNDQIQKLN